MPATEPKGKKLAPIYVILIALGVGVIGLFVGRYSVNCDQSAQTCTSEVSASPESFYEDENSSALPKVVLPSPVLTPSVTITATFTAEPSASSSNISE
jgi:hypothetical protein